MNTPSMFAVALLPLVLVLAGCASNASDACEPNEEKPIVHTVSDADRAFAQSKTPLTTDSALLYVNGMGCPLCASNIDLQLLKVRGVSRTWVDLGIGTAIVHFEGDRRPSPYTLGYAVEDAGFTLVKIVAPAPPGATPEPPAPVPATSTGEVK